MAKSLVTTTDLIDFANILERNIEEFTQIESSMNQKLNGYDWKDAVAHKFRADFERTREPLNQLRQKMSEFAPYLKGKAAGLESEYLGNSTTGTNFRTFATVAGGAAVGAAATAAATAGFRAATSNPNLENEIRNFMNKFAQTKTNPNLEDEIRNFVNKLTETKTNPNLEDEIRNFVKRIADTETHPNLEDEIRDFVNKVAKEKIVTKFLNCVIDKIEWKKLDKLKRELFLKEKCADDIVANLNVDKPTIKVFKSKSRGKYDPKSRTAYINEKLVESDDPEQAIRTMAHELRHKWQVENKTDVPKEIKENLTIENYIREGDANPTCKNQQSCTFKEYYYQPAEIDARDYADQVLKEIYPPNSN